MLICGELIHNPYKNAQNITNRNLTHILDISYMKRALDGFTYEQVEELKKDIQEIEG